MFSLPEYGPWETSRKMSRQWKNVTRGQHSLSDMAKPKATWKMWTYTVPTGDWTIKKLQHRLYDNSMYGLIVRKGEEYQGHVYWLMRRSRRMVEAILPQATWVPKEVPSTYSGLRMEMIAGAASCGEWGWPPKPQKAELERLKLLMRCSAGREHLKPDARTPYAACAWLLNGMVYTPVWEGTYSNRV